MAYRSKIRKEYVVQFMWRNEDCAVCNNKTGLLIEQLRYAGLITVVKETEFDEDGTCGTNCVYQLRSPHVFSEGTWATQNAERMQSFGINAVVVRI